MKKFKLTIAYKNGNLEEVPVKTKTILACLRALHRYCNKAVTLQHKEIKQILIEEVEV